MVSVAALIGLVPAVAALTPSSIKSVVAFGDSLSDTGNLFKLYGIPGAPYWQGRFCNGPIWVEHLSGYLSNATLYDFAYAGSTANVSNAAGVNVSATPIPASSLPDISQQFALFQKDAVTSKLDLSSTLFTVFAGGNDIDYAVDQAKIPDVLSIAGSVVNMVATLLASGAENVLINNMAPLHLSPRMKPFQALSAQIKMVVDGYNQVLAAGVASLSTHFPKANIAINDINGLLTLVASPEGAVSFKYANVDGSCFNYTAQTVCAAPDTYFFWDGIHPSTRGQDLMAQYGFNQLFKLPGYFIAKPATTTATTVESLYKPTQAPSVRPITNLYSSASALAGITLFSVALSSLLL